MKFSSGTLIKRYCQTVEALAVTVTIIAGKPFGGEESREMIGIPN